LPSNSSTLVQAFLPVYSPLDLVSVLYHALQGDDTLAQYIDDAEGAGDEDLADHFRDIQEKYREIAQEAKDLLREKLVSGDEEEEQEDEEDT
jgi:hypothetical protein